MHKILAIFMALMLSLSLLTGCGSDKKAAPDSIAGKTVTTSVTTQSKENISTKGNEKKLKISESAAYTDKEHVAAYINEFAKLPHNYITKNEAKKLGWQTKGTLDKVAPGKSIGGDRYGNYEKKLPEKNGRSWKECDIDYVKGNRNGKRIVFSSDGLIYYTGDHYNSFTKLYGK